MSYHVHDNRFGPFFPRLDLEYDVSWNTMNDFFELFLFDPWIISDSFATKTNT